jgi:hypothetical protein
MDTDEFITQMKNSKKYSGIFNIMVRGRSLLLVLDERDPDDGPMTVATSLLHPKPRFGLTWNNVADRVPIMRIEANYILRGLSKMGTRVDRFEPTQQQQEEADDLSISLNNYLTETAATAMPITYNIDSNEDSNSDTDSNSEARGLRKRKRKRKSIKTKSRKTRKTKKSRKTRKSRR